MTTNRFGSRRSDRRDNPYARMKKECTCPPEGMVGDPDCPIHNDRGRSIYAPPVGAQELAKNYTDALEYIGRLKTQLAASEKDREARGKALEKFKAMYPNSPHIIRIVDAAMKEAK